MITLIALSLFLFLIPSAAFAQSVGLDSIFANGASFFSAAIPVVGAASYILGIAVGISAVFALARRARDPSASLKKPIVSLVVAACLLSLPLSIKAVSKTLILDTGGNPGSVLISGTSGTAFSKFSAAGLKGLLIFIQLVGIIAFVRGWLLINRSAMGDDTHGYLSKGIIHIVGGACAIHISPFAHILANTFMPGVALPF